MRISGLSGSGLDIDGIVSETMEPYKLKVTNKEKEMNLYALKQTMYHDIIESGQNFYDKYLSSSGTNSLSKLETYATIAFSSSNSNAVSARGLTGAEAGNYTVSVKQMAEAATKTFATNSFTAGQTLTISVGDKTETFTLKGSTQSEIVSNLNSALSEKNFELTAKYSDFSNNGEGGIKLQGKTTGEENSFKVKLGDGEEEVCKGKNAIADITNAAGETKHYTGASNNVTLDNIQFTFNSITVKDDGIDNKVSLSGKTDVDSLKETIVNFVNDYNKIIEDLNTKLSEKRDSTYMPLTSEEKAAMNDNDIKLWEEKVKTGLFRNDSDLSRIASEMKNAMQTMMSDTGLKLEDIGIEPVDDYKTKNGTLKINDEKLTEALKNNIDNVKEIFTSPSKTTTLANGAKYESGGVISTLSNTFQTEFVYSSKSLLIQKAGTKSIFISSTMTKELTAKQKVIDDMNEALTTRETNLYNKYSKLETALSKLYSQQNWLTQQLS